MIPRSLLASGLAALLLGASATGALADASPTFLDKVARGYTGYNAFMGGVIAFKGDQVLLEEGLGQANVDWSIPNAPGVRYRIGSVTKQFTAAIVLQLRDEGKLKVSDPISKYLDGTPATWKDITIAELLGHTSGIANFTNFPDFHVWRMSPHTPAEEFSYFKDKPLDFTPGTKFSYSNSGYFVLGMLIEKVSGHSYAHELKTRILEPLGMTDSGLDADQVINPRRAQGYSLNNLKLEIEPSESLTVPWSAGSMYSTPADLMKWIRALFHGKVLSAASLKEMTTPGLGDYGFGLFIHTKNGVTTISHGGGIEGFSAQVTYVPAADTGAVVLSNVTSGAPAPMAGQLIDAMLGKPVTPIGDVPTQPIAVERLKPLVGAYHTPFGFDWVFEVRDGVLMQSLAGRPFSPLVFRREEKGALVFFDPTFFAEVVFRLEPDGAATVSALVAGESNIQGRRPKA